MKNTQLKLDAYAKHRDGRPPHLPGGRQAVPNDFEYY
jgi:hypothetical protein